MTADDEYQSKYQRHCPHLSCFNLYPWVYCLHRYRKYRLRHQRPNVFSFSMDTSRKFTLTALGLRLPSLPRIPFPVSTPVSHPKASQNKELSVQQNSYFADDELSISPSTSLFSCQPPQSFEMNHLVSVSEIALETVSEITSMNMSDIEHGQQTQHEPFPDTIHGRLSILDLPSSRRLAPSDLDGSRGIFQTMEERSNAGNLPMSKEKRWLSIPLLLLLKPSPSTITAIDVEGCQGSEKEPILKGESQTRNHRKLHSSPNLTEI